MSSSSTTTTSHETLLLTFATYIMGILGALQVTINSRCGAHFEIQIFGTVVSFGGGWLMLTVMVMYEDCQLQRKKNVQNQNQVPVNPPPPPPPTYALASKLLRTLFPCCCLPLTTTRFDDDQSNHNNSSKDDNNNGHYNNKFVVRSLAWSSPPPLYYALPGVFGATFVTTSIALSAILGYALFWIPSVLGQLLGSAFLDHIGFSLDDGKKIRIGYKRMFALIIAIAGAALSVVNQITSPASSSSSSSSGVVILCVFVALFVGCLMPLQASINRRASKLLPSRIAATWWSFTFGTLAAFLVFLVRILTDQSEEGSRFPERFLDSQFWHYLGGPLGVLYIATTIYWTGKIGVGLYFVALVSGQLTGSAIIDSQGWFGSVAIRDHELQRGFGIFLVILAAGVMQFSLFAGGGTTQKMMTMMTSMMMKKKSGGNSSTSAVVAPSSSNDGVMTTATTTTTVAVLSVANETDDENHQEKKKGEDITVM